jgi:hypothetical protein
VLDIGTMESRTKAKKYAKMYAQLSSYKDREECDFEGDFWRCTALTKKGQRCKHHFSNPETLLCTLHNGAGTRAKNKKIQTQAPPECKIYFYNKSIFDVLPPEILSCISYWAPDARTFGNLLLTHPLFGLSKVAKRQVKKRLKRGWQIDFGLQFKTVTPFLDGLRHGTGKMYHISDKGEKSIREKIVYRRGKKLAKYFYGKQLFEDKCYKYSRFDKDGKKCIFTAEISERYRHSQIRLTYFEGSIRTIQTWEFTSSNAKYEQIRNKQAQDFTLEMGEHLYGAKITKTQTIPDIQRPQKDLKDVKRKMIRLERAQEKDSQCESPTRKEEEFDCAITWDETDESYDPYVEHPEWETDETLNRIVESMLSD